MEKRDRAGQREGEVGLEGRCASGARRGLKIIKRAKAKRRIPCNGVSGQLYKDTRTWGGGGNRSKQL